MVDRRSSQAVFSGAQCQDKRPWAQKGTEEFPSEHQQTLFHCEVERAQVAQRGCGGFLLGNTQEVLTHGPGQSAVGSPASPGSGQEDLQESLKHSLTLPLLSHATHFRLCPK